MPAYETGAWDLSELADDPDDPRLERQVRDIREQAEKFGEARSRLDPEMSSEDFAGILSEVAGITDKAGRAIGYASLLYSADTQSDKATSLVTRMRKLGADVSNRMLFFDLWWKTRVDAENAARLIGGSGELARYLAHKRLLAEYSLSESEERIINTLDVTGISALVKLYDKITNTFEYRMKVGGRTRTMTREEITNYTRNASPGLRETAYKTILAMYAQNSGVVGDIYQNIVLNWRDEGIEIRGYESPISMRNTANDIDDRTTESLLEACRKNSRIFHRFFAQKAKMLDMKKLRRYDLYAPFTGVKEKRYRYDRAARLVLESLGRFSGELEGHARRVFDENHIDSEVRHGKRDGAFCSTLSPDVTPYVLINFTGKTRDVFTLAHELGHAVHSQAARDRSILVQDASLPLAETASTFSELLLYDNLSDKISDDDKVGILSEKIDDLYATIMRQSFFTIFEIDAHKRISDGITIEGISSAYMRNLKDQFGRSVTLSDDFGMEWSCIPHFYHTPFYCYAYSFGNLLALSLFQRYKKEKEFASSYMEILAAGGSRKPEELLKEHGFDIGSSRFWQDGFDYIARQVRTLSRLC